MIPLLPRIKGRDMKTGRDSYRPFRYQCASGHSFKSYQWLSRLPDEVPCTENGCNLKAGLVLYPEGRAAQGFVPPIAAFNPVTKEYRPLAGPRSRIPHGFEKVELRTAPEINQFVRSMNEKDYREYDRKLEMEQRGREGRDDPYRDYRAKTEFGRQLMEHAEREAGRRYAPRFAPSNFFECFEMNPSNLD